MHFDTIPALLNGYSLYDAVAVSFLFVVWFGLTLWIEREGTKRPSVHVIMTGYRKRWMAEMADRDVRIFDSAILNGIRQSTAFFGSTTLIAIGGIAALIGQPEAVASAAGGLLQTTESANVQGKLLVVLLITTSAFLKFVWSNRLFSYCAIVMAAMPNDGRTDDGRLSAQKAALLNTYAAKAFNRGLRAVYFGLATLAWLLGPQALILATLVTTATLVRREFFSASREILLKT